tara:strand:+ start:513 stop:908 length:396 start_codon:yes stop_codon:yes gene_type:complete
MTIRLESGLTYKSNSGDSEVEVTIKVTDITMDILKDRYPTDYNTFYGSSGVTMPSTQFGVRTCINNESTLENWQHEMVLKYGFKAVIILNDDTSVWFDKTLLKGNEEEKDASEKHMREYIESERKLGRSID